jgi:endonuclease III
MFHKRNLLLGLFIVSLSLTAFSNPSQAAGGGIPGWVWIIIIVVVLALLIWWWLSSRSQEEGAATAAAAAVDDLTRIEGIGPKIAEMLKQVGITNFAQLAAVDVSRLKEILEGAGLSALADPTTWAEQAKLAAEGKWDELQTLQDELKGGRRA